MKNPKDRKNVSATCAVVVNEYGNNPIKFEHRIKENTENIMGM